MYREAGCPHPFPSRACSAFKLHHNSAETDKSVFLRRGDCRPTLPGPCALGFCGAVGYRRARSHQSLSTPGENLLTRAASGGCKGILARLTFGPSSPSSLSCRSEGGVPVLRSQPHWQCLGEHIEDSESGNLCSRRDSKARTRTAGNLRFVRGRLWGLLFLARKVFVRVKV